MLLAKNWWVFALRGAISLIFGILAIFLPENAFLSLVLVFGIYAMIDGIFTLISAFGSKASSEGWWWLVLSGVAGIVLGIVTLLNPFGTAIVWLMFLAAWAIITGFMEILTAIRMRKIIENEWLLILSGIISIVFGFLVILNPFSGMFAVGLIIGIYALIWGIILLILAFRLKKRAVNQN